jgi:hypothetical protein
LRSQAGAKNVAIGLIIIDDENARRIVHRAVFMAATANVL